MSHEQNPQEDLAARIRAAAQGQPERQPEAGATPTGEQPVPHSGNLDPEQGGEQPVENFDNTSLNDAVARGYVEMPKSPEGLDSESDSTNQDPLNWDTPTTHPGQPEQPAPKGHKVRNRIVAAVAGVAVAGGATGAAVALSGGHGKEKPSAVSTDHPGKNHSATNPAKQSTAPSPTDVTVTSPSKSPVTTETGNNNETHTPHTYTLNQSTIHDLTINQGLSQEDIQAIQTGLNNLSQYNLMQYATSDDPMTALKAYSGSLVQAVEHNDFNLATSMLEAKDTSNWGISMKAWFDNVEGNNKLFGGNNKLVDTIGPPKDVSADYSNLAQAPYYQISPDGNSATVAFNDKYTLETPAPDVRTIATDGSNQIAFMQRVSATDESGQPSEIWLITKVISPEESNAG